MLKAYNEWNDIANTRDKWEFCRENFLSGKTLDMIAQLKRQLLELLSGYGFDLWRPVENCVSLQCHFSNADIS